MGLLDQVIGGVLGQVLGGGREPERGGQGGALGGAMSPLVQALLMLLMSKGAGGLGDLLGGGHSREAPEPRGRDDRQGDGQDDGDVGGFGQDHGRAPDSSWDRGDAGRSQPPSREGDFSDLSGMLDGPGQGASGAGGHEAGAGSDEHPPAGGGSGLDGLIEQFQRGGLGDVIGSWIGHGENRPVAPNRLADALGPETVDALERRTGLNRDDLLGQLAHVLPQVVDKLTPQGRRPTGDDQRGW